VVIKISGKQLRHMSEDDWRQWLRRIRAKYAMLVAMDKRHIADEQDQRFHASADQLGDLITALGIVCAEV